MSGADALLDKIITLKLQLKELELRHFDATEAYGWVWWTGVACMVVLPFIWWKMTDKKQLAETCLFGLIVMLCAACLDIAGSEMVLWQYRINIIFPLSLLMPIDFVIVPAITTTVYQKCPGWGAYMLASVITAGVLSFGLEPLAICIGQYKILAWRFYYSFPIYLIINLLGKFVTQRLKTRQILAMKSAP